MGTQWTAKEIEEVRNKAEAGDSYWQVQLGWGYYSGSFLPKDIDLALEWMKKARRIGSDNEKFEVAKFFYFLNKAEALDILEELTEKKYGPAFYMLGEIYREGKIVNKDMIVARSYWSEAARRGNLLAESTLRRQAVIDAPFWKKPIAIVHFLISLGPIAIQFHRDDQDPSVKH